MGATREQAGEGSSPRERGKPGAGEPIGEELAAHPRVSGENCSVFLLTLILPGSSPRERGKQRFDRRAAKL